MATEPAKQQAVLDERREKGGRDRRREGGKEAEGAINGKGLK